MKKRVFGLVIFGFIALLVLVFCVTLPGKEVNNNKDNNTKLNTGNIVVNKGKRTRLYSLVTVSNPFTDNFPLSDLLLKMNLMTEWSNGQSEKVEDFSEFKFYFTCRGGNSHFNYYDYINVLSDTKITEALEIMKQQDGITSIDRWFKVKIVDEKYNLSFEQEFYYNNYLQNRPEEENYPTLKDKWDMPIYSGDSIQYYVYKYTSNNTYSFLDPTLIKVYGTNKEETFVYFETLKNDGFVMYDSNIQKRCYYKPVSDYSIVVKVVLDMSPNDFNLKGYDVVTLWISDLPNPTSASKESTLPDELVSLGMPSFDNSKVEYAYEHGQDSDMLFVYNFSTADYYKLSEKFTTNGFSANEYENEIYYEKRGLKVRQYGTHDSPYLCFEFLTANY